jgi:hypothetical protein
MDAIATHVAKSKSAAAWLEAAFDRGFVVASDQDDAAALQPEKARARGAF